MALIFPNRSRSFDEVRKVVRFLGYDGMFEVPFLVQAEALVRGGGTSPMTEADCLAAFDAARDAIYDAARRAYAHGRDTLTKADLR
jgi:hypothetical protein